MLTLTFSAASLFDSIQIAPLSVCEAEAMAFTLTTPAKNYGDVSVQTTPYQGKSKAKKAIVMIKDNIPLGITLSVSPNTCRVGQVIGSL